MSNIAKEVNQYRIIIKKKWRKYSMASGDTKTQQYLDAAANGTRADLPAESCCETRTQSLIREVAERIMDVEDEVERLENNPDVVDIVDTYADLQAYSTSGLTDKDVIRVITDETQGGLSSYYRWNSPNPGWNFVGVIPGGGGIKELSSADYNYPTANPDRVALWLLDNGLYTAPAGVMVAASTTSYPWYNTSDKTILVGGSDTVKGIYTFLNGKTDVVTTQASDGTEADEYTLFKSTQVLQATGTSTADVMSQNATTSMVFDDPSTTQRVKIGNGAVISNGAYGVVMGSQASIQDGNRSVALGYRAAVSGADGSVALGTGASASRTGEVNIGSYGSTAYGFNNTNYRVIGGVHDPQNDHDAATKGYVDTAVADVAWAKVLTTADYNDDPDNPRCIDVTKLSAGWYIRSDSSVLIYWGNYGTTPFTQCSLFYYTGGTNGTALTFRIDAYPEIMVTSRYSSGFMNNGYGTFLKKQDVVNNLTNTNTDFPLSAAQGKVLNDKIGGDLSSLDTTDKTSLIAAINELTARVAALEGS